MSYDEARQEHLNYKYKDDPTDQKMTPKEEIEMLLNRALRDSKLGYNVSAQNCIDLALTILGEIDEN